MVVFIGDESERRCWHCNVKKKVIDGCDHAHATWCPFVSHVDDDLHMMGMMHTCMKCTHTCVFLMKMALMHTYAYTLGDGDADDDDDDAHACQICWVFQPTYNNSMRERLAHLPLLLVITESAGSWVVEAVVKICWKGSVRRKISKGKECILDECVNLHGREVVYVCE